jgi:hypothetical protein
MESESAGLSALGFCPSCGGACVADKGQFPKPFAKLLFAGHRASQPQFRCLADTLHPETMRWSMERSGFRFASRSAKLFGGVPVVHGVPFLPTGA